MRVPRNPIPVVIAFLIAFWLARNGAAAYIHLVLVKIGHALASI